MAASKILLSDGKYYELTNSGSVTAVNVIHENPHIPAKAKKQAIEAIVKHAHGNNEINETQMQNGEQLLGLTGSGDSVIVNWDDTNPPTNLIGFEKGF